MRTITGCLVAAFAIGGTAITERIAQINAEEAQQDQIAYTLKLMADINRLVARAGEAQLHPRDLDQLRRLHNELAMCREPLPGEARLAQSTEVLEAARAVLANHGHPSYRRLQAVTSN